MYAILQRHCAKRIYIVPDGIREFMSIISRVVLGNQEKNIELKNLIFAEFRKLGIGLLGAQSVHLKKLLLTFQLI